MAYLLVYPAAGNAKGTAASAVFQDSSVVELPFIQEFDGELTNGLVDKNNQGTGFTTAIPYSGTRLPADGSPSDPAMPAYEASRLSLENGELIVQTNKGIDFLDNNNQINLLAVEVRSDRKLEVEARLEQPYYGTSAQQGGVWFGLNDKTFLKLVATGNKIEFRREVNDVSSNIKGTANPDQRLTGIIGGLQFRSLRLRLVVDPVSSTAEAFYSTDGENYISVGEDYPQASISTAGMGLHAASAYAGIYATHRNAGTPVTYRFEAFHVKEIETELPSWEAKINFQDPETTPPAGWLRDYGQAFGPRTGQDQGDTLSYGWKKRSDGTPLDLSVGGSAGNGRNRGMPADVLLATLVHMQGNDVEETGNFNGTPVEGYWEIEVPNGVYDVTVSAGDADRGSAPEVHALNVEGINVISGFSPSGAEGSITRFTSGTARVTVEDGYLTINADGGTNTKINSARIMRISLSDGEERPYVIASAPPDGAVDVSLNTVSIAANHLYVPTVPGFPGGVDNSTITTSSVLLTKSTANGEVPVPGVPQGTGGGDAISFTPSGGFEPNTNYTFTVTDQVRSYSGARFIPYEANFTTEPPRNDTASSLKAAFTKVPLAPTTDKQYTSLAFGPDGKLYALRINGTIERYEVDHQTGAVSNQEIITTITGKYGNRSAVGFVFDPLATPENPIAWVSHSSPGMIAAPLFDGNISRLSGSNLQNEQLMITNLPRSKKDHMTNSMAFGPDGALYITQGGTSSMGAYDPSWQRDETLLAATVLRVDLQMLNAAGLPLDVRTTSDQNVINNAPAGSMSMSDGTYNPYGSAAPVTIYASGVRNAYDLVWHTNGQLYVPVNGSGGGGSTPASVAGTRRPDGSFYDGPQIPATENVRAQDDWLLRVNPEKGVGYFGHPNPLRGEYVAFRGYIDNPLYPNDIVADVNYRGTAYAFGPNKSANGIIEYMSDTFNGALKGKLLVCRFSGGGDIMVLEPGTMVADPAAASEDDAIFDIVRATPGAGDHGLLGMSDFVNPLDIVEDTVSGNLYVAEFNWRGNPGLTSGITLLRVSDIPDEEQITRINFQEAASEVPAGYIADTGLSFDEGRGFGWIDPETGEPKDHTESMRTRTGSESLSLRSLAHMQASTDGQTPGSWEYATSNGWYHVTVSVGDPGYFDSEHQINVEGTTAIAGFTPSSADRFRQASVVVEVSDGRLSIDATGGDNTKINYVHIAPTDPPAPSAGRIAVQNMDLFPAADHLTFSRIQVPWRRNNGNGTFTPYNANHDKVTLRINNEGTEPLIISGLSFSNPDRWLVSPASVSEPVAPGEFTEVTVEFTAEDLASRVSLSHDTLYIASNDAETPVKKVMLHGLWQRRGESTWEPYAREVISAFNFTTNTGYNANDGNIDGETIVPNSDEILAPFFVKADPSKPVSVLQLAAYHGCCNLTETFHWYAKGSNSLQTVFRHNVLDGQSLLPRLFGSSTQLARGTFDPAGAFGLHIGGSYSDRTKNVDEKIGIRVWKAIDADGNEIPNAYLIGVDYLGSDYTNFDYQDNIYYIENIISESAVPPPPPVGLQPVPEPAPESLPVEEPEEIVDASVTAYPNPNQGTIINLRLADFGSSEQVDIVIRDILGRPVLSHTMMTEPDGSGEAVLRPGTPLTSGLYIIKGTSRSATDDTIIIVL